jgi:pyrroline-5-carboxylate reductase
MLTHRIGFIGAGQMARALAGGMLHAELLRPEQVTAFDPVEEAADHFLVDAPGARVLADNAAVLGASDVLVLAVKPQVIYSVMSELRGKVGEHQLIVSIAAGVSIDTLQSGLDAARVIRVMPNTPCLVGRGASAYALGPGASRDDGELVGRMLGAVGMAFELAESLLDAVTGLSGSGPAFVYMMIEALSDGGVRMGLPRATAQALAVQTLRGAAEMVQRTGEHPGVLKDRVTSPGGTTIAGIQKLEELGLRGALIAAVQAASERSRELASG